MDLFARAGPKSVIALSEGKGQIGFCAWKEIRLSPFRCYPGPAWSEGQPSQGYTAVGCVSLPCSAEEGSCCPQDSLSLCELPSPWQVFTDRNNPKGRKVTACAPFPGLISLDC